VGVQREAIEELAFKYAEMLSMRLAHASGEEDAPAARARMVELAKRFPGALREIDDLELAMIRDRIARLARVLRGEGGVEPWMEAVILFHTLARGALCAKRWLSGRKQVDSAAERAFAHDASVLAFPDEARAWAADLAQIASPPRGRLTNLVFARVARALGTSERQARRLVFGPRAAGRRPSQS
jgi:hypothetical protein